MRRTIANQYIGSFWVEGRTPRFAGVQKKVPGTYYPLVEFERSPTGLRDLHSPPSKPDRLRLLISLK